MSKVNAEKEVSREELIAHINQLQEVYKSQLQQIEHLNKALESINYNNMFQRLNFLMSILQPEFSKQFPEKFISSMRDNFMDMMRVPEEPKEKFKE